MGAFRPLVRRAGRHTNAWFAGWAILLLHIAARILSGPTPRSPWLPLLGEWALELGGVFFLRAASRSSRRRTSYFLSAEIAVPIFAQSALVVFDVHRHAASVICTLLMAASGVHLLLVPSARTVMRLRLGKIFTICAVCIAPLAGFEPALALSVVHCMLFLSTAAVYWDYTRSRSAGVFTAVSGLVLWGLTYPLTMLLDGTAATTPALAPLWQLPTYIVAFGMILTLIEAHVERTENLALHDSLTGLPNRRLFEDRLAHAVAAAPGTGTMLACLVIDVDNFKQVNDTLGHAAGDELLRAVATRLSWHIQPGDTLARTGGDEFAAVFTRLQSIEHLRYSAGALMSATSAPVVVGRHAVRVGISIGIAVQDEACTDLEAQGLHRRADHAMYVAKRDGGNRIAYDGGEPDEVGHLLAGVPEHLRRFPTPLVHS